MFRLIIALGVAGVLMPAETITQSEPTQHSQIDTFDAFHAAQSLYFDVITFCDRNEKACETGKTIALSATHSLKGGLNQLTQSQPSTEASFNLDNVKTGSIQK